MNALRTVTAITIVVLALTAGTVAAVSGIVERGDRADAAVSEASTAWPAWGATRLDHADGFSARATRETRPHPRDVERPRAETTRTAPDCAESSHPCATECRTCEDSTTCVTRTSATVRDSCGRSKSGNDGKCRH